MLTVLTQAASFRNQILAGLPRVRYQNLFSNLRPLTLNAHQILYHIGDNIRCIYFINYGLASLISTTVEGDSIEVGNVGTEGIVGTPILLRQPKTPHQVVVQVPGEALVVSADILRQEFEKEGELKNRLLSYTYALETYISQLGVCSHFHTVDKRLCRWLLVSSFQVQSQSFHLTHESLSQVLGTGRTGGYDGCQQAPESRVNPISPRSNHDRGSRGLEAISCDCSLLSQRLLTHCL